MKAKPAYEVAARALCRFHGHPENITFEGKPMWRSFIPEVTAVLVAIGYNGETIITTKPSDPKNA